MPERRHVVENGEQYSRLTVLGLVKRPVMVTFCECVCECGVVVYAKPEELKKGITRSCGCLNADTQRTRMKKMNTTHGCAGRYSKTPEYRTWASMKGRCTDQRNTVYPFYGGRGIKVCERWASSFEAFLEDMGHKPSPKHSIDRINSDGNYEPGNCKWSTDKEQNRNRRSNRNFTVGDETMCMTDWAKKLGIHYKALWTRIDNGWTMEQVIEALANGKNHRRDIPTA